MARYKVLKSVAHSLGHSFTSLMNFRGDDYVMGHLLRRARQVREGTLFVDLLTGEASPTALLVPPVREAVQSYAQWLPGLVHSHRTEMHYIRRAQMTVFFDLTTERPHRHAPACLESPFVCRVEVEDDRGKVWSAEFHDWWFPEPDTPSGSATAPRGQVRVGSRVRQLVSRLFRGWWTTQHSVTAAV